MLGALGVHEKCRLSSSECLANHRVTKVTDRAGCGVARGLCSRDWQANRNKVTGEGGKLHKEQLPRMYFHKMLLRV
jgi:hypothetical protein